MKLTLAQNNEEITIPVDSVITSIGYLPGTPLANKDNEHIHILGDADVVGNLKSAIWAANDLVIALS